MSILKILPFSIFWIIRFCIGSNVRTILDLGCGDGKFTQYFSFGEDWQITGVDLYKESIFSAKSLNVYEDIIEADVINLPPRIKEKKYDVILGLQVIEHLKKEDGIKALALWEKLASKKIIIATPIGYLRYDRIERSEKEKNRLQKHLSGWTPKEFLDRGYKVYGQGLRIVYGQNGQTRNWPHVFWPILFLFSYLAAPIVFFYPNIATYMFAVKKIKNAD